MAAQTGRSIDDAFLEEAFEKARMGVASAVPDAATLERVARHEAGHTLIAWLGGNPPVQVTIVGRGGAGGFMERDNDEQRMLYTRPELEQLIREAMGGRAAEILYYGEEAGLSTGASSDLRSATHRAVQMVREFGMDRQIGQIALGEVLGRDPGELGPVIARQVEATVRAQLDFALARLKENRAGLDRLVSELLVRNRLTREELGAIIVGNR